MAPGKGAGGGGAGSLCHPALHRFVLVDPRPRHSVRAAAAFAPDSFYDFKAEGYKAQHTPGASWVCLGWREHAGRTGVLLGNTRLRLVGDAQHCRVSVRARGAALRPS